MKPARRPFEKWAFIWPAFVLVLLGLVAVLVLPRVWHADKVASDAKKASIAVVQQLRSRIACLNESLAVRQKYTEQDHRAEVAKVSGQVRGLLELHTDPEAGILQFTRASEHYLHRIAVVDRHRKAHPLGQC